MEPTFYRISLSAITYVECWRVTRNLFEFVLICFVKTLRLSSFLSYAVTDEGFQRLQWDEVRDDVQRSLQGVRAELETLGFRYCFCYTFPMIGTMQGCEMVLLSNDGNSLFSVKCERHESGSLVNIMIVPTITSELSNGTFLSTCQRQDVMPPEIVAERRPNYSIARLADRHRERIAESSPAYAISLRDDYEVERRVLDLERRIFQHALQRGLLVPLGVEQVERYRAKGESAKLLSRAPTNAAAPVPPAGATAEIVDLSDEHVFEATLAADSTVAPASRYPGVIAELEKIRNKKGSWLSGAVILGISVALFLGAGAAQWDWHFVLLLIPILLFHEMGHFVAMRVFKYRNMKMFFIPLLGAAVTGRNYNVAGWKKAVVSLAGPVPGIVVGTALGVVALVLGDQPLLLEAATLTVFLNAFNLLPFLPLDGGWIVHVLLFSRHHVLDAVFRFLAAATLILSGFLGFRFLMFIGIVMLLGLRTAYRVAKVTSQIRDADIDTSSPDGQSIPVATADEIISRLDASTSTPVPDVIKAQQTLQVFESVNARPPGVLGTLALGSLHAGSFLVAIVFAFAYVFVQRGGLDSFAMSGIIPLNHYDCGTAEQWPPAAKRLPAGEAATLVATFWSGDAAGAAFAQTKLDLPEGAIVTRFGQSVLVTLEAASRRIDEQSARFEAAGATVDVMKPGQSVLVTMDATLDTLEQAETLEKEVSDYFSLPMEMAVIPPWYTERTLTEPQRIARHTYHELVDFRPGENERHAELRLKLMESFRQKDQAKTREILEEQKALERELRQEHDELLLARDDLDKQVIEIYLRQPQTPDWSQFAAEGVDFDDEMIEEEGQQGNPEMLAAHAAWQAARRDWYLEMGSLMGQLPRAGDNATTVDGIASGGWVERNDLVLRFSLYFKQTDDGALAVAKWLCGHHCTDVKYAFGNEEEDW